MRRLRRTPIHPRIELIPLIDVMTFLLTYFIFATATLMRVDLVPMQLRSYQSGKSATPAPAVTISVDLDGRVFVDKDRIEVPKLAETIKERLSKDKKTVVYLAIADGQGKVDRAPLMQDIYDRLRTLNITVNLVGRPGLRKPTSPAGPGAPGTPGTATGGPAPGAAGGGAAAPAQ